MLFFFFKDPRRRQIFFPPTPGEGYMERLMGPLATWASSFWMGKEKVVGSQVPLPTRPARRRPGAHRGCWA